MAQYFQLLDNNSQTAVPLHEVDRLICELLETPVHERYYGGDVFNWFDTIGYQISCGKTLDEVLEYYTTSDIWQEELPVITKVIELLKEKFTVRPWVGR